MIPDSGCHLIGDWTEPLSKESVEPLSKESLIADAIDDPVGIEGDLERALWHFEEDGADDAHWHFRLSYEIHWGRHLKELSLYVFEKIGRARF